MKKRTGDNQEEQKRVKRGRGERNSNLNRGGGERSGEKSINKKEYRNRQTDKQRERGGDGKAGIKKEDDCSYDTKKDVRFYHFTGKLENLFSSSFALRKMEHVAEMKEQRRR